MECLVWLEPYSLIITGHLICNVYNMSGRVVLNYTMNAKEIKCSGIKLFVFLCLIKWVE